MEEELQVEFLESGGDSAEDVTPASGEAVLLFVISVEEIVEGDIRLVIFQEFLRNPRIEEEIAGGTLEILFRARRRRYLAVDFGDEDAVQVEAGLGSRGPYSCTPISSLCSGTLTTLSVTLFSL